jgi:LacI family transcriptional regulator
LRGHPKIPPATTARVRAAAEQLGYRPNPGVAALMAHIRRAHPVTQGERIAFLWLAASPKERTFPEIFEGARKRAEQLGYILEEFWLESPGMDAARLSQIIRARGITGVVISPIIEGHPGFAIDWDWGQFAPAIIGNAACRPELHHAAHHHFDGMRSALLALRGRGLYRIAALIDLDVNERAKRAVSGAFIEHHSDPATARQKLRLQSRDDLTGVATWLRRVRPEALITTRKYAEMLVRQRSPWLARMEVAVINRTHGGCRWPGIDQAEDVIAANAVDLVVEQLLRNERGIPRHVKMVLVPGRWIEECLPPQVAVPARVRSHVGASGRRRGAA